MEKRCCEIKITEIDDGYAVKITGAEVKDKCRSVLEELCSSDRLCRCLDSCCGLGK